MPVIAAALERGVHYAAAEPSIRGIVGVGHDLEFLHSLDVGRELPRAVVIADGSSVQEEEILAGAGTVDLVGVIGVPSTCPRETSRPEGLLREDYSGR